MGDEWQQLAPKGTPAFFKRASRFPALRLVTDELQFLLPVVEDFEENHPAELFDALRVTVGAGILADDVLNGFDDVGDVGNKNSNCLESAAGEDSLQVSLWVHVVDVLPAWKSNGLANMSAHGDH